MADVARQAGVSLMTVSRVINHKGEVSAVTQKRVMDVVERLGYRPSGIARSLATQRTRTLGLVVPDVANPFFAQVARGVEQVACAQGYNVFLCNTDEDPSRELAVLRSLEEKQIDGLVLCSSRLEERPLAEAITQLAPVVLVNRLPAGDSIQSVLVNDFRGGRLATEHLLTSGCCRIGFLAGPPVSHSGQQRLLGYRAALQAAAAPSSPDWVRHGPPTVEGGLETTQRLLLDHPELDALFCYNDLVAVGALQACSHLGRGVPGDVAVVGFDDIPLAALVTPPLTTCQVPRFELGATAVQLLLAKITGRSDPPGQVTATVLEPQLIVRDSAPRQSMERR